MFLGGTKYAPPRVLHRHVKILQNYLGLAPQLNVVKADKAGLLAADLVGEV